MWGDVGRCGEVYHRLERAHAAHEALQTFTSCRNAAFSVGDCHRHSISRKHTRSLDSLGVYLCRLRRSTHPSRSALPPSLPLTADALHSITQGEPIGCPTLIGTLGRACRHSRPREP